MAEANKPIGCISGISALVVRYAGPVFMPAADVQRNPDSGGHEGST